MTARWYCVDCETAIEKAAIDEHEADGHTVKGTIRPDRLLRNDPWNMGIEGDAEARAEADDVVSPTDRGADTPGDPET